MDSLLFSHMYNQGEHTSHRTKNMKQQLFIVSAIFTLLLNPQAFARSGSGVGTVSNPTDWLAANIENRIRHTIEPIQKNNRKYLGFDLKEFSKSFEGRTASYSICVDKDGSIASLKLLQSSGSDELDKSCRSFIEKAAPFRIPGIKRESKFFIEFPSIIAIKDLTI